MEANVEMSLEYGVTAKAYLKRCSDRLREVDPASLFYAAFELRCCVEARQAEYLEHYNPIKNKKIQPFRIGENAKKLAAIRRGDAIGRFEFQIPNSPIIVGYHTPVSDRLKTICERNLDCLRHAQSCFRKPEDRWWVEQRELLIEAYRLAWVACKGDVPMPPLWDQKSGATHPIVFNVTSENAGLLSELQKSVPTKVTMGVSYLESVPEDWVPDL